MHYLIVGAGKTGRSCAEYLARKGERFSLTDTRAVDHSFSVPGYNVLAFCHETFDQAECLIVSPGISLDTPLVKAALAAGKLLLSDVDLFCLEATAPIVAITGSNGKSTVTSLVGKLFETAGWRAAVGGNLGTPVLELLQQEAPQVYVLELSSFQLERISHLKARVATVLNVCPDHLDRYVCFADYRRVKSRIFVGAEMAVVNDEDLAAVDGAALPLAQIHFGANALFHLENGCLMRASECILPVSEMCLVGRHNALNALAALALVAPFDLPLEACRTALQQFPGLPHRCELIIEVGGVRWINDSKATNVGAAAAALKAIGGSIIWVAGGEAKESDFSALLAPLQAHAKVCLLIGRDASLLAEALMGVQLEKVETLEAAVNRARELAMPGDTVLLAPACASFDQFANFEARGERFKQLVLGDMAQAK